MAVMELWRRRDLEGTVKPEYIDGNFFTQDSVGNLVGVKCYKDGAEVALTGSVTGYCVLPSGETVSVAGTRSGNQASILVPQSALAYTGPLGITLKLIDGNTITTLMRIIVVVYRSKTDTVITPSSQIITDWANQIAAALQEVEDASAAQDVKIADLKSAIDYSPEIIWSMGAISSAQGTETDSSTRIRTGYTDCRTVEVQSGYKYIIAAYNGETYIGMWNGSDFVKSATWLTTKSVLLTNTGYKFRLVLAKANDASIGTADGENLICYAYTDTTLTIPGAAADAKKTREAIESAIDEVDAQIIRIEANEIKNEATGTQTEASTGSTILFKIQKGLTYLFTNTGDVACAAWTRNLDSSANVDTITQGIDPHTSVFFTALHDADKVYFYSAGITSVRIYLLINNETAFESIGVLTPEMFGAVGDGVNDDTYAMQEVVKFAATNGKIVKLGIGKTYLINDSINMPSNTIIYGYGSTVLKNTYSLFRLTDNKADQNNNDENFIIKGLRIESYNDTSRGICVSLNGADNVLIEDCTFINHTPIEESEEEQTPTWCILLSGDNIFVNNCFIDQSGAGSFSDGIHLMRGNNVHITNCTIYSEDDCIGLVPEYDSTEKAMPKFNKPTINVYIENCTLESTANCFRAEARANASSNYYFKNIIFANNNCIGGTLCRISDYRSLSQNGSDDSIIISNINMKSTEGTVYPVITLDGTRPDDLHTSKNLAHISIDRVNITECVNANMIRCINTVDVSISNLYFYLGNNISGGISFNGVNDISISDSYFVSNHSSQFMLIQNADTVKIQRNKIYKYARQGNGIGIYLKNVSLLKIIDNELKYFAYALATDSSGLPQGTKPIDNLYLLDNINIYCSHLKTDGFDDMVGNLVERVFERIT